MDVGLAMVSPVFVHGRTVARRSRLFEDPLLLTAIFAHQVLARTEDLLKE